MRVGSVALAALVMMTASCPCAAQAAATPTISLSVPASAASGATVTATGTVRRAPRRARVVLQRRSAGTWVNLKRSGLKHGRFRIRFRAPASATPATLSVRAVLVRGERRLKTSVTRRIAVRAREVAPPPPPPAPPPGPPPAPPPPLASPGPGPGSDAAASGAGAFFAGAILPGGYGSRDTSTTTMQVDDVRVWAPG
jgi:hypothetical protein